MDFLDRLSKNTQISDFMKIRPVEAELFRAFRKIDRQTDRHDEANSSFSQFVNAPKNRLENLSGKAEQDVK